MSWWEEQSRAILVAVSVHPRFAETYADERVGHGMLAVSVREVSLFRHRVRQRKPVFLSFETKYGTGAMALPELGLLGGHGYAEILRRDEQ